MNIMAGLQAFANAGTGYIQGLQNAQQNKFAEQANTINLQSAQDRLAAEEESRDAHAKYMNYLLTQSASQPPSINPPQVPGTASQQIPQKPQIDPSQMAQVWMDNALHALSDGSPNDAETAMNVATHFSNIASNVQRTQDAAVEGDLKRQQQSFQLAANTMSSMPHTLQGFNDGIRSLLANPIVSQEEKSNLIRIQGMVNANPSMVDQQMTSMENAALTSAQRLSNQLGQQRLQQQAKHDQDMLQQSTLRTRIAAEQAGKRASAADHRNVSAKMVDLTKDKSAMAYVNNVLQSQFANGTTSIDAGNGETLTDPSDEVKQAGLQALDIASQIMHNNPAVSKTTAINQAIEALKKNGNLMITPPQQSGGKPSIASFNNALGTRSDPIPITVDRQGNSNIPVEDLEAGRYYTNPGTHKTLLWTGSGWQNP